MRILITGIMGSGKSTQAKKLAEKLNLCFLTTQMLRDAAKRDDAIGEVLRQALSKGDWVDDKIVADLAKERLTKPDAKNGFVSDSYPRRVSQIGLFDPLLDKVFYLKVDPKVAKQRLLDRGRADDKSELIDYRQKTQFEGIEGVVNYYKDKIGVIEIDASKNESQVFDEIVRHLDGSHA